MSTHKIRCESCPVPAGDTCRSDRFPWFCDFAATGHPTRLRAVVNRNAIADPSPPDASFPPLAKQARNLAGAVGRQVRAGIEGEPMAVSPEVQEARLAICRECEPYFDAATVRCRHPKCGCRLSGVLSKTSRATERCPINKW